MITIASIEQLVRSAASNARVQTVLGLPTYAQATIGLALTLAGGALVLAIDLARRKRPGICDGIGMNPVIGHAKILLDSINNQYDFFFEQARHGLDLGNGSTSLMRIPFNPPFISTLDPRNVEYVLKTNFENFVKGPEFYKRQMELLGHGIFNSDGASWKAQRKAASHIFAVRNFRDFIIQKFEDHAQILVQQLDKAANAGTVVDMHDLLHRFTLDSFLEIGFGKHISSLDMDEPLPFAKAFDTAQAITAKRFLMSSLQFPLVEWLNGDGRKLRKCVEETNKFASEIIAARRADPTAAHNDDLLSRFMSMKNPHTGNEYSDEELRDVVINFIIAGRDTTAQALSWCLFRLAQNPRVVECMREEIARIVPPTHDGALDYETYARDLVYIRAVFSEALRLHPSVPVEIKYAVKDDVLPDGSHIKAGDSVVWSPWVMGRLRELWGPDAEEFHPERFLDSTQPTPYVYPVFNAGPRTCLGQAMAQIEGTLCLVKLVQRYNFELVNPNEVNYRHALTLQMKQGLKVRVSFNTQ